MGYTQKSDRIAYSRFHAKDEELYEPRLDLSICIPIVPHFPLADLVKADTPLTTAKISRMLHQLEFKLQVEMQYKNGIDKMAKLYQADLDKKSRQDLETRKMESKRVESDTKIQLLQTALKQYKNLHILDDAEEEEGKSW